MISRADKTLKIKVRHQLGHLKNGFASTERHRFSEAGDSRDLTWGESVGFLRTFFANIFYVFRDFTNNFTSVFYNSFYTYMYRRLNNVNFQRPDGEVSLGLAPQL